MIAPSLLSQSFSLTPSLQPNLQTTIHMVCERAQTARKFMGKPPPLVQRSSNLSNNDEKKTSNTTVSDVYIILIIYPNVLYHFLECVCVCVWMFLCLYASNLLLPAPGSYHRPQTDLYASATHAFRDLSLDTVTHTGHRPQVSPRLLKDRKLKDANNFFFQ